MLAGLAVALVLSSPVPVPKPITDLPADMPSAAASAQPGSAGTAPASAGTPPAIAAGAPAPGETRPVIAGTALTSAAEPGAIAPAAKRKTAAAVPIPPVRPARLAATPESSDAGDGDEAPHDAGEAAAAVPRPRARPDPDAPVVKAMLTMPRNPSGGLRGIAPSDMVCRDPRIAGQPAATFVGGIPGCGILDPVRVASIAGIRLSAPVTVDCRTARKFADWLTGVAQPAAREALGSGIASIRIMGSYACRTRNNRPGERLSEHSVGRAVDVGGVTLVDGRRVRVREDWGRGAPGAFLRRVWMGACGGFTTVIGPDGDRHHQDHLHLDAAYRDSTWCR